MLCAPKKLKCVDERIEWQQFGDGDKVGDTKLCSSSLSTRSMSAGGRRNTAANWRSKKEVLFSKDN